MTSNTTPSGQVLYGGVYTTANYFPYYAFDGNDSTQAIFAENSANNYIGYKFTTAKCVKKIKLKGLIAQTTTFKVQGSNDGTTWTDIKTGLDYISGTSEVTYNLDNSKEYTHYKLQVTGSASTFNLSTLQFYG